VVPEKRKLIVVSAAIAAAFALPGCAPAGYNSGGSDYGAQPAANAVDATPEATAEPTAGATPGVDTEDGADEASDTPELSEDEVTTELKAEKVKRMGETVQNEDGFVLYRFDKDKVKPEVVSNCNGDCEKIWPPAVINKGEEPKLEGVDADLVGTVERKDGTLQLTLDKWPLYTYIGDKKPGQWKGQNVAGSWFVVTPEGKKNLTCLPPPSKAVAPPADDENSDSQDSGGDAGSDNSGSDYSY
jgi:predicted lipoprotein with Yx(FWY)xxD motif